MTLQNRMALDLLLAKEQGVCGCLTLERGYWWVDIPNETRDLQRQQNRASC